MLDTEQKLGKRDEGSFEVGEYIDFEMEDNVCM